MLDRTIPYFDIIMRCDRILPMEIKLPEGYAIRAYQPGDEDAWATLMCAVGEQTDFAEAKAEFTRRYLSAPNRIFFAADAEGTVVGTAIAWNDSLRVLHWLAVHPAHQRKGLGRALCQTALRLFRREDNSLPVWLHTQPWSWKAILLYVSLGFKLQPRDTIYNYENQYAQAMETLKAIVTPEQFAKIKAASAPDVRTADISAIRYDARGLVPAIAQDAYTGEVLMQAYMNAESLQSTLESGYATYWSRSRNELWRKGATSGHLQKVIRMSYDCDADSILMQVDQTGPACLAGQAVGVALDGGDHGLAGEAADLLYHLTVLLYQQGVSLRDVWEVLKKRHT